jgi:hypothetical protein
MHPRRKRQRNKFWRASRWPTHRKSDDSKLRRKLTRKTLADRCKGRRRKILLDHLIEKREGRPVGKEELEKVKARIAEALREISLRDLSIQR